MRHSQILGRHGHGSMKSARAALLAILCGTSSFACLLHVIKVSHHHHPTEALSPAQIWDLILVIFQETVGILWKSKSIFKGVFG